MDLLTRHMKPSGALGLMLIAVAMVLLCSAIAVAVGKPLPAVVFTLAAVRFLLVGIYQLSSIRLWERASGVLGLLLMAAAVYTALALELEGQRQRPVLPTFRRHSPAAPYGPPAALQLEQLAREPGVRPVA